jgi:hypothetical protein
MSQRDDELITLLRAELARRATATPREGFDMRTLDAVHRTGRRPSRRPLAQWLGAPAAAVATAVVFAAVVGVGVWMRNTSAPGRGATPPAAHATPRPSATPSATPRADGLPRRSGFALAWDPVSRRLLLFGGEEADQHVANDTWAWDGRSWAQLPTAVRPPFGLAAAMAVDPHSGRLLLVGGTDGTSNTGVNGGTWTWDGTSWHRLPPSANLPFQMYKPNIGVDPQTREVLVDGWSLGGRQVGAFAWNGSTWHAVPAPSALGGQAENLPAHDAGVAFDAASGRLLHGGGASQGTSNDTYVYDGHGWSRLPTAAQTRSAGGQYAVLDERAGKVLMLEPDAAVASNSNPQAVTEVWESGRWTLVHPAHLPPIYNWGAIAWDPSLNAAIYVSGSAGADDPGAMWSWDGSDWSQLAGTPGPGSTSAAKG